MEVGMQMYYWRNPEDTERAFEKDENGDWWFKSGDICEGVFDEENKRVVEVRVIERKKNFFRMPDGIVIFPEKMESILEECPSVRYSAVLPKKDGTGFVIIVDPGVPDLTVEVAKAEICEVLGKNGLPEPAKVVVDTVVWSPNLQDRQHGTLTVSLKPNRIVLAERFAAELI
jgi:long-subunit acyl-CoA synthetase (AMP-forming)